MGVGKPVRGPVAKVQRREDGDWNLGGGDGDEDKCVM